jgi:hypothetical protein
MTELFFTNGYGLLVGVGADLPVTVKDAIALRDVLIDPCRAAYTPDREDGSLVEQHINVAIAAESSPFRQVA